MTAGADERGRDPLTPRQQLCYDFIVAYAQRQGFPPTFREIGAHMGIGSTHGIYCHLVALEKKGYVRRAAGGTRAIEVLQRPVDETLANLRARANAAEDRARAAEQGKRAAESRAEVLAAKVGRLGGLLKATRAELLKAKGKS